MIPMERAVETALNHFRQLYRGAAVDAPLLEGVEPSEDKKTWRVTIGFNTVETFPPSALDEMMAQAQGLPFPLPGKKQTVRRYRLFQIDAEDGSMSSMHKVEL